MQTSKIAVYAVLVVIAVLVVNHYFIVDPGTLTLKNAGLHNEIGTYRPSVHQKLLSLLPQKWIYERADRWGPLRILEIGAGNGNSTEQLARYLDSAGVVYRLTIVEADPGYLPGLRARFPRADIRIGFWENRLAATEKFDVILNTAFSTVTVENAAQFLGLLRRGARVLTLLNGGIPEAFGLRILGSTNYGLLNLYLLSAR